MSVIALRGNSCAFAFAAIRQQLNIAAKANGFFIFILLLRCPRLGGLKSRSGSHVVVVEFCQLQACLIAAEAVLDGELDVSLQLGPPGCEMHFLSACTRLKHSSPGSRQSQSFVFTQR